MIVVRNLFLALLFTIGGLLRIAIVNPVLKLRGKSKAPKDEIERESAVTQEKKKEKAEKKDLKRRQMGGKKAFENRLKAVKKIRKGG
jgi:hypothetical protein